MSKKFASKIGDVFTIPIDDNRYGIGVIVYIDKGKLMIAVLDSTNNNSENPILEKVKDLSIVFLGYTLDAKLYHKHWPIVARIKPDELPRIYFPYYKIGTPPDKIYIVNHKGDRVRPSTLEEFKALNYETTVAPIRYENALKAHFNLGEWKEDYDCLLYTRVLDSVKLVDKDKALKVAGKDGN